jgi:hypothetical protein
MAEIRYSLRYEETWWQDVCRIEPHPLKWEELFGGIEDFLERTPEAVPSQTRLGNRVMRVHDFGFREMPSMYVFFSIEREATDPERAVPPGGLLSLMHVITEADVRAGLFYDYSSALAEECRALREELLRRGD